MQTGNSAVTLEQFKEKHYGKRGTAKRDKPETGYIEFKIGAMIHDAPLEKGMTQEELADKCGTNKAYFKGRKQY